MESHGRIDCGGSGVVQHFDVRLWQRWKVRVCVRVECRSCACCVWNEQQNGVGRERARCVWVSGGLADCG